MHEEQRNLLVALTISIILLLGWQYFYAIPQQQEAKRQQISTGQDSKADKARQHIPDARKLTDQQKSTEDIAEIPGLFANRDDLIKAQKRINISSKALHGSIRLEGAELDDLTLVRYHQSPDPDSPEEILLSPRETENRYFARFGWVAGAEDVALPSSDTKWSTNDRALTPESPVTLSWDNGSGVIFKREISLDDDYLFAITQKVTNNTDGPITLYPYGLLQRIKPEHHGRFFTHQGVVASMNNVLEEIEYSDLTEESRTFKNTTGWTGFGDKYWLTALVPPQDQKFNFHMRYQFKNEQQRFQTDFMANGITIAPGKTGSFTTDLFAGAKKVALLDKYSEKLDASLFDRAVDFGALYFISKPIFILLHFFNNIIGNFGIAIILLTLSVRILLFPLANKSYRSMAQMRKYQPQLQEIRKRYKNDLQKMQHEMRQFYQEHKINPLSGCLPILLQLPIFFALYRTLSATIEMRHAPFYGWIKDLSAPDPANIFTVFGLLDWGPPDWFPVIGLLPLLFGMTMFVQQRLNPSPPDPTQAKVMKWLPFIFTILFASFPAGLVLYWTCNNILSITQQAIITRRIENPSS